MYVMGFEIGNIFLWLHLFIWGFAIIFQASRVRLGSPPTCQLRQGGTNDVVNQQLKELNMKKLKLLVVRPSDDRKTIYKNLIRYLEQQGIRIVKGGKNEK